MAHFNLRAAAAAVAAMVSMMAALCFVPGVAAADLKLGMEYRSFDQHVTDKLNTLNANAARTFTCFLYLQLTREGHKVTHVPFDLDPALTVNTIKAAPDYYINK